jgi:MFS family permease
MSGAEVAEPVGRNHPLAPRMGFIAFLNGNITLACVWGSFTVLLAAVQTRLGVGGEQSAIAASVVNLSTAFLAPFVGALAARLPLRTIMIGGATLSVAGFALLAVSSSYPLYLAAYGLLLGPGMAVAVVLPQTLVTRWFVTNRGRALGLVTTPLLVAVMFPVANWMVQTHGLTATYVMLAAIAAVNVVGNLFVVERPPGAAAEASAADAHGAHGPAPAGGAGMAELARTPRFWMLSLPFMALAAGSIVLTAQMAPMARGWGYSPTLAATLLSIQSFAGIAGTVVFGWVADRLGGARTMALLAFNAAVIWVLLLLDVPFAAKAVLIALYGLHGAGPLPVIGVALSEAFGKESFSRAFGLVNLANLPVSVVCVPLAAAIGTHTGSYAGAIMLEAGFLLVAALAAFPAGRARSVAAKAAAP